jgi:seryl-tRNA synthetase
MKKMFKNIKNIKDIFNNSKTILTTIAIILAVILGFKIIDLIKDSGLVVNKDETLGKLKVLNQTYENVNQDLSNTIKSIKETNKINDAIISDLIDNDKNSTEKNKKVKKKIDKKIKHIKTISKTIPKNINNPKIQVNSYAYRESGKVMIESIWNVYNNVKDSK